MSKRRAPRHARPPSIIPKRVHIRVVSRNEENGHWNVIGETDDGKQVALADIGGVQHLGDGIDVAHARGVELRISDEVYAWMHEYKDAWYPRPPSAKR